MTLSISIGLGVTQGGRVGVAPLMPTEGFTATSEQTTLRNLDIYSDNNPLVTQYTTTAQYIRSRHKTGMGLAFYNIPNLRLDSVEVLYIDSPSDTSAHADNGQDYKYSNIFLYNCNNARISNVLVGGGSTGIYALECDNLEIEFAQGTTFFGPLPRGQFIQFNQCSNYSLTNFSAAQSLGNNHVEDIINAFLSMGYVGQGLINGCGAPNGVGVMCDEGSVMTVEDVDCINMINGAFVAHGAGAVMTARNVRSRDNSATGPRGDASSGGLTFGAGSGGVATFENAKYFNPARYPFVGTVYDGGSINGITENGAALDAVFVEEDFNPRAPFRATLPAWPEWIAPT